MNNSTKFLATVAVLCAGLASAGRIGAADWPAYRHDLARSGVTPEALAAPLHRQWVHAAAHAPRPAWPEPGRELNRVAFDYAYDVTVAKGLAYFGSSADHKVYAIDLGTGRQRWSFFTEGPVRFAPTIEGDRVFVASDDGRLYCLSAADGKLLWRFHGAPRQEKIMGNGQLISRWPLRAGVGVEGGVVYFAAGMWPSEGVYVYALRAEDGTVLWENATSGTSYVKQPHPGSFSMTGVAPQGYVLGHDGQIFVPTGRNVPAAYDRRTGKLLYYRGAPTSWSNRWGGVWNFLADGWLFGWRSHIGPDIDVQLGEFTPHKDDGIVAFDAATGKEKREFTGKLDAVVSGNTLYASGGGKVTAYDLKAWLGGAKAADCTRWETPHGRAYALIMAARTLVVGGKGTVTAIAADTGRVLWQDKVKGQARSLAAADGRLLAGTTEGRIYCYGPKAVAEPPVVSAKDGPLPSAVDERELAAARTARNIIDETGKKAGYCVVLGAGDGRLLYHLAKQSDLVITCAEADAKKADAARRALDAARLYGVRVTVHHGTLASLGYPDYFADLIVMGDAPKEPTTWSAEQLYRVLRPYGGRARIPIAADDEASRNAAVSWLKRGKVPQDEIKATKGAVQVVRGPLPGAGDWTHQYASAARTGCSDDQRVRLPLRLLWFGEPGPDRLITRHWGGPAPLCVSGRMFVIGQRSLMATDAYNGRQLWRRDLPTVGWWPIRSRGSSAAADSDSVYLVQGKTCLRLDAATGKTVQTYRLPAPPAAIPKPEAEKLAWSYLAVGRDRILGSMGGHNDAVCVFLLGKDGNPRWTYTAKGIVGNNALSMDERRVYVIDRSSGSETDRAKRRGQKMPVVWTLLALDADTGKTVWQTDEGISGRTALWLAEGVLLATGASGMTGYTAADGKLLYVRPAKIRRFPVIARETVYTEPAAYDLRTGYPRQRTNPFTGGQTPWEFHRSYGCGAISAGPNLLMFRSGTLGMYDLAGDGGVFNFGGVRAGCYVNAIAAGGLVLAPPADAACSCSYSLRTTVALMPAQEERNWSIFYDRLPTTTVTRAAFNLGATGDRRDQTKTIWLALPRPATRTRRSPLAEPFRFTFDEGFGAYSHNTDRTPVAGTDRPWIYASGLKGLRRAELDLEIFDRGVTAWPAKAAPTVDGKTAEVCWNGYKTVPLAGEKASVTLRHDDENLYLAYKRPAAADPKGKPGRWKAATEGSDAAVWRDDSFEVYLSNIPGDAATAADRCLHLGVSASGARYDALWTYATPRLPVRDIGRLDAEIDGKTGDWGEEGLKVTSLPGPHGKLRAANDFDPSFRIAWNEKGLLLLAEIKDNVVHEWEDESNPTLGDSVEVFLAPKLGAREGYRCVLTPGSAPKHEARCRLYHYRKAASGGKLTAEVAGRKTPDGYVLEALLPWANLGMAPRAGDEVAMQLLATDDDAKGDRHRFRALWHQAGDPGKDPFAYQRFRLAAKPSEPMVFKRDKKRGKDGLYGVVPPHPLPADLPPLGAGGEDADHAGTWTSAAQADAKALIVELAVPWKTLTDAGLGRTDLMIDLESRGPLRRPPLMGRGFERMIVVPEDRAAPKTLSVRLHFAELEDRGPGERVFDVKLQGKVVLKDLDVVKAAGGRGRALVKQFDGIAAAGALAIELVPKAGELTASTAPIISGIEVTAEGR